MPRLPTIRVIGSQAMSTSLPASGLIFSVTAISISFCHARTSGCLFCHAGRVGVSLVTPRRAGVSHPRDDLAPPAGLVPSRKLGPVVTPLGFLVHGLVGDPAHTANERAVGPDERRW